MTTDIIRGAVLGAGIGGFFLGIGLVRALFAVLSGRLHLGPPSAEALRFMGFYVGTFALVGAGLGAAKPLLRTRGGIYAGLAIAGAVIMIAFAVADRGGIAALTKFDWIVLPIVGAVFGCAAARGWLRGRK